MKTVRRVGNEYLAQAFSFALSILDRVVLTAILLRAWGVNDFAIWSIVAAAAAVVALFDFGANLYFANRILFLVQQKRVDAARAELRAGNLAITIGSLIGVAAAMLALTFGSGSHIDSFETQAATLALALMTAVRQAGAIQFSVYRAHGEYARQSYLLALLDAVRILGSVGLVAIGQSFLGVAIGQMVVTIGFCGWIALRDVPRRFTGFGLAFGMPAPSERRTAAVTCAGYWLQSAPNTALTYAPIVLLATLHASAITIAQFVLMRTIGNLVRTTLQQFSIVLGQEAARRLAVGDTDGLRHVYREASIFLAAQTAAAAGILFALGVPLFRVWTGEEQLFNAAMLWLAIGPPLLLPSMTLGHNLLATINRPWPIAIGRSVQLGLALILIFALPIEDPALRMMAALAIAEVVAFGLPVMIAADRIVGVPTRKTAAELALRCALVAMFTGGVTMIAAQSFTTTLPVLIAGLAAGGVAAGIAIFYLGFRRERRALFLAVGRTTFYQFKARIFGHG
jgi:O-antigen/teichoic acid export membrane protein